MKKDAENHTKKEGFQSPSREKISKYLFLLIMWLVEMLNERKKKKTHNVN